MAARFAPVAGALAVCPAAGDPVAAAAPVASPVCGAIAGAHYSAEAIPALWRDSLLQRRRLEGFADRLLAHALLGLGA